MKRLYIFLVLISISFSYLAQSNLQWAKAVSANYESSVLDAAGNVYITGQFQGTPDFDPGPGTFNLSSNGWWDIFILKLDPNGNFLWAKSIGSSNEEYGYGISVDAGGNAYITGKFVTTVDFNPGPAVFNMTPPNAFESEAYILKLNPSGNFLWAKQIGGTNSESGTAIVTDNASNIYLTGVFQGTCDFDPSASVYSLTSYGWSDAFVCKLDVNGNFIWADQFGGTDPDSGDDISIDAAGNVYATGYFNGIADLDPGPSVLSYTSNGSIDGYVVKLNSSGSLVWSASFGSWLNDFCYAVTTDVSGNVYTTGRFTYTVDFDPGPSTYTMGTTNGATFISKLNSSGNFVAAYQLNGPVTALDITLDPSGNIYTTGYFGSTIDFDPGPGVTNLTSTDGSDIFISKLDATGNYLWAAGFGSNVGYDAGEQLLIDAGNNLVCTGDFVGTVDFDASTNVYNLSAAPGFVMKYCTDTPFQPSVISGSITLCANASSTYSVASTPNYTYTWNLPPGWSGSSSSNLISAWPGISGTSGTISVSANNGCGSSLQQTLFVTVNPTPTISVNSGTICNGQSFTISPSGGISYTFSNGQVVSPTTDTWFSVVGSNTLGCTHNVSCLVSVNPSPTVSVNSGSICAGNSFTIVPSGASSYTFPSGPIVNPVITTSYAIIGSNTLNCTHTAICTVTVHSTNITVNSGSICTGDSFTMAPSGASTYTFSSGPIVAPLNTTTYSVIGTGTSGCISLFPATSTVVVHASPTISISGSNFLCAGQSLTLTGSGANSYTWVSGPQSNSYVITPTASIIYTVDGSNTNSCLGSATKTITVFNGPTITITSNTNNACEGQPVILTASGAPSFTWSNNVLNSSTQVNPLAPTTIYSVTGANGPGCTSTQTITISTIPAPTVSVSSSNSVICAGQAVTLTATGAISYSWSNSSLNHSIVTTPSVNTTYTVFGFGSNGCSDKEIITQYVMLCSTSLQNNTGDEPFLVYPNPVNDILHIKANLNIGEWDIECFNMQGQLLLKRSISSELDIDISKFPKGLYYFKLKGYNVSHTAKVIKN